MEDGPGVASVQLKFLDFGNGLGEADYLNRRVYGRTYLSRSFPFNWGSDAGESSRRYLSPSTCRPHVRRAAVLNGPER